MKFPTPNVKSKKQFLYSIEKRFRKEVRINKLITPKEEIKIYNNGSYKFKILIILIKKVFKNIVKIKEIKKKQKNCIIPWSADDEINMFLEQLYNNKKFKNLEHESYKKPLLNILDEELICFAKLNNIKIDKLEKIKDPYYLKDIKKIIPNVKFSLLNSIKEVNKL